MSAAIQQPPPTLINQARACGNTKDCMAIYEKWAASYNDDVGHEAQNYVAPTLAAALALRRIKDVARSVILDAGCGTGLVGQALASLGAKIIDGCDLSDPMLKVARQTGVYRNLVQVDMNEVLRQESDIYDVVTCVGTFTSGHVGPNPGLRELVRVTKKGGTIVFTVLEEIWLTGGFKAEVEKLKVESAVTVIDFELLDYVKGHGDKAMFVVLEKI